MTDYGGKIGEILHELSRFVAFSCRFRRCSDHRIARHGQCQMVLDNVLHRIEVDEVIRFNQNITLQVLPS